MRRLTLAAASVAFVASVWLANWLVNRSPTNHDRRLERHERRLPMARIEEQDYYAPKEQDYYAPKEQQFTGHVAPDRAQSAFEHAAGRLSASVDGLDRLVSTLEERLQPALGAGKPGETSGHPMEGVPGTSGVVSVVWETANTVDAIASRVRDLLDRVELT